MVFDFLFPETVVKLKRLYLVFLLKTKIEEFHLDMNVRG